MAEGRTSLGGVESADDDMYHELVARAGQAIKTGSRTTPCRVRDDIVRERVHKAFLTVAADLCEFDYRSSGQTSNYRVVAL